MLSVRNTLFTESLQIDFITKNSVVSCHPLPSSQTGLALNSACGYLRGQVLCSDGSVRTDRRWKETEISFFSYFCDGMLQQKGRTLQRCHLVSRGKVQTPGLRCYFKGTKQGVGQLRQAVTSTAKLLIGVMVWRYLRPAAPLSFW